MTRANSSVDMTLALVEQVDGFESRVAHDFAGSWG